MADHTPPRPAGKRTIFQTFIGLLVGLLIAGLIGGGIYIAALGVQANLTTVRQTNIPELLPDTVQVYASVSPGLDTTPTLPDLAHVRQAYPGLFVNDNPTALNELLAPLNLDAERDVLPWVGARAAVAMWDVQDVGQLLAVGVGGADATELFRDSASVIIINSRDNQAANIFLAQLAAELEGQGASINRSTYGDVPIYEATASDALPPFSFALARNCVIIASRLSIIQDIIDRPLASPTALLANERYTRLRDAQRSDAVGTLYVDLASLSPSIRNAVADVLQALPPDSRSAAEVQLQNVSALEALGLSLSFLENGIALDATLTVTPRLFTLDAIQILADARAPISTARLNTVSADAIGLFTFRVADTFGDQVMQGFNAPTGGDIALQQLEFNTGINPQRDWLRWFQGDAALVLFPGVTVGDIDLPFSGYLALQTPFRDDANAGLQRTAAALGATNEFLLVQPRQIRDVSWTTVSFVNDPDVNDPDPAAGFAQVGNDVVIAVGLDAMRAATIGDEAPISADPVAQASFAPLPDPNSGIVYATLPAAWDGWQAMQGAPTTAAARDRRARLDALLSPAVTVSIAGQPGVTDDGIARFRMFLLLPVPGEQATGNENTANN